MAWVGRLVPDGLWELFQRVVPAAPVRPQGGGRRRYGDREVLAAILFVARTGCTWRQLPPVFGPSGPTAHRRFTEWIRARGVGQAPPTGPGRTRRPRGVGLGAMRDRLGEHAGLQREDLTGPNPVDRGKKGSKIHLITERSGLPLSIGISAANTHDGQGLEPLVRGVPPIRSRADRVDDSPPNSMATRGMTTTTCGGGCAPGTSPRASHARASSPPRAWAATAGLWNGRWPGCPGAAACTGATSARPNTSSPSPASPPPSSAIGVWVGEPVHATPRNPGSAPVN